MKESSREQADGLSEFRKADSKSRIGSLQEGKDLQRSQHRDVNVAFWKAWEMQLSFVTQIGTGKKDCA